MKIRLFSNLLIIFFISITLAHAYELRANDLLDKIRGIVDLDFRQSDQLKPVTREYATSFNKIYILIKSGLVEKKILVQQVIELNQWLDLNLSYILNQNQMNQWNKRKKDVHRDILTIPQ